MRREVDDAVAHHAAGQQGVRGDRQVEVAHLVGRDPVFAAGPLDLSQLRVPPDVEGVDRHARPLAPDTGRRGPGPGPGWRSPPGRRRTSGAAARAPAARRSRRRTGRGRRAGRPPAGGRPPRPSRRPGRPPTTRNSSRVPSAAASMMAARLSASAAAGRPASAAVRNPPRHSDGDPQAGVLDQFGGLLQCRPPPPGRATVRSRDSPAAAQPSTASRRVQLLVVAVLSDSRGAGRSDAHVSIIR